MVYIGATLTWRNGNRLRRSFLSSKKGLLGVWLEIALYNDPYLYELVVGDESI